jgi:succinoglycan biosynthesis protein ExoM
LQLSIEYILPLSLSNTELFLFYQNISIARNACLDNADSNWLACIDDDEVASINWLSNLYKKAQQEKVAVVCGPVKAIYDDSALFYISLRAN